MEIKAKDMCPRCKYCLGMTPQGMYSCGKANDGSELNIGIDVVLNCANFEWKDGKVEGKAGNICPKCKNCKCITQEYNGKTASIRLTRVDCEDPYDGMTKTLDVDSDICCSMFEPKSDRSCDKISLLSHELEMDKLRRKIHELEKEKSDHLKGIERLKKSQEKLQNQVKNLQTTNEESYKREEKLEDKVHKLERRLLEENKRFARLDSEFLIPLSRVLYPREAKICKPYSEILKDIKLLNKEAYDLKEDNKRLAERNKSLKSDIEDLKKRAADSDYYKEKSELLEEKLKKDNKLADSWQKDYERLRDQFVHPIYNILYPDKPDLDINVTDLLNYLKDLKVYANENGSMYKEVQGWRERCIYWSNKAASRCEELTKTKKDRDKWRELYNSLSEICADYDKRCKEECEKKYRDEISKLQNIVTEKEVEIKGLKREIINLTFDRATVKDIMKKNIKFKETISDQEITIKALLITIKEMCKEENENA